MGMLLKTSLDISSYPCVEMAFFILNNVDEPKIGLHDKIIPMNQQINIDFSEFEFSFVRSSGPGGQSVNTANSKAQLSWDIDKNTSISADILQRFKEKYPQLINEEGRVYLSSQTHRSQKMNMDDCITKLYELLKSVQFPPKKRRPTKPKKSAVRKRLDSKKIHSLKKQNRNYKE